MSRYETVRFEPVKRQASKNLPCPDCGKKVRRSRTFEMTISPFNRNAEGQPRTRAEIWDALGDKAAEWQQKAEQCTPCSEKGEA